MSAQHSIDNNSCRKQMSLHFIAFCTLIRAKYSINVHHTIHAQKDRKNTWDAFNAVLTSNELSVNMK